ncbi:MAG: hypothetical protein IJO26_02935 [Clostridium sp.]|nr:hypothetical protein [Clostridium sp.]
MKGKIIDYNFSEAFVLLEDDTIVKISLNQVSNNLNVGDTIALTSTNKCNYTSNKPKFIQDKIVDFF